MITKTALTISIFLFSVCAESASLSTQISRLQVSGLADFTYASQYMTDGFKVGDGEPVMQPLLRLTNSSKEYTFTYWGSIQTNREKSYYDEHDLFLGFNHNYLIESKYAFNFHTFYDYWFFPSSTLEKDKFGDRISNIEKHGSKVQAGVSFYNLLPIAGSFLVPSYNLNYWIYWKDDRRDQYQGGARHEFLLQYHRLVQKTVWNLNKPYAGGSTSINYNDGAFDVKPGWSHATAGLYAGFHALSAAITASMNYQWTFEKTVTASNEFWSTLSLTKDF